MKRRIRCKKRTMDERIEYDTKDQQRAISYRKAMLVSDCVITLNEVSFYICPRCKGGLIRENMRFCDLCGQCLDWSNKEYALPAAIFRY